MHPPVVRKSLHAHGKGGTALVVAHPGHELRVHGWLERTGPHVYVLTDGSGGSGSSRLEFTTQLLTRAGARPGTIYGRWPDAVVYELLLKHDPAPLLRLVEELAGELGRLGVRTVVSDAAEGYDPVHDLCRLLVDAAVRRLPRPVASYDFPLLDRPDACPPHLRTRALWLHLDADAQERKWSAARANPELAAEVESALTLHGRELFAVECLRPVVPGAVAATARAGPPAYEIIGRQRVASGRYRAVIGYAEHLAPLVAALDPGCREIAA